MVRPANGRFSRARVRFAWFSQLLYFGLPWLQWDQRQALRIDLAGQRLWCFDLVLWPQDLIVVTGVLVLAALALFLAASLVQRPWCGYGCPHSVYGMLFLWIERRIEGSAAQRRRRAAGGARSALLAPKLAKHGAWLLASAAIGWALVGYFSPVRELALRGPAGWEWLLLAAYGGLAYVNAGLLRDQFCRTICPAARLQSVMQDGHTRVIAYDAVRGEPRALRNRKQQAHDRARQLVRGDCVDCTLCVQVCPTGMDIRAGQQADCIGCGACIDACDGVMDKLGKPRGLVGYRRAHQQQERWLRPWIYGALLLALGTALWWQWPAPLRLAVLRDRAELVRAERDNAYRLHVANRDAVPHRLALAVEGAGATLLAPSQLLLPAGGERVLAVTVRMPAAPPGPVQPIRFELRDLDARVGPVRAEATFVIASTH